MGERVAFLSSSTRGSTALVAKRRLQRATSLQSSKLQQ